MKALDNQQKQTSGQFKFQHESFDEDEKEGFDDVEEDSFNFTRFIRNLPDLWYEIYCRILHYYFFLFILYTEIQCSYAIVDCIDS